MINELAHLFRAKNPISIVVDVLEENWIDVADWTGARAVEDELGKWLTLPSGDTADIGDVIVKNGDTLTVYKHDEWYGPDGLSGDYERVMFDAPEDE